MSNICICANKLECCERFTAPGLLCGAHQADLAFYLSQLATITHACMVVASPGDYQMIEALFEIHYPDPHPLLGCIADVVGEVVGSVVEDMDAPWTFGSLFSVDRTELRKNYSLLLGTANRIAKLADTGSLVDYIASRQVAAKILIGEWPERDIAARFVGLADLFPLVRKIYPLDLIDDMPTKASPCLACGWRSSLDRIGYHRGRVCSCLNSYCVYANMKAIGDRVDCLRLRR
nr:MAG TPA: hypothetical protein [Caudoviricetes sp.]